MLHELRELRKKHGFTQEDMAKKLNVSPQLFSFIERGEVRLTYNMAVNIANLFSVTPDQIFLSDISSGVGIVADDTGTDGS